MADPKKAVAIGVKVAAANIGEFVIVRNLTQGFKVTGALKGTDRSIALTPAPTEQWNNGDVVQAEIRGRLVAVAQKKIQSGTAEFRLAGTADTATAGISL